MHEYRAMTGRSLEQDVEREFSANAEKGLLGIREPSVKIDRRDKGLTVVDDVLQCNARKTGRRTSRSA